MKIRIEDQKNLQEIFANIEEVCSQGEGIKQFERIS
jgi:hypothetical protein